MSNPTLTIDNRCPVQMSEWLHDEVKALRIERERLLAELLQANAIIQERDRQIQEMDAEIRERRLGGGAA